MKRVAIVSACRTAVGTFGGGLKPLRAPQLAAVVMKEVRWRARVHVSHAVLSKNCPLCCCFVACGRFFFWVFFFNTT